LKNSPVCERPAGRPSRRLATAGGLRSLTSVLRGRKCPAESLGIGSAGLPPTRSCTSHNITPVLFNSSITQSLNPSERGYHLMTDKPDDKPKRRRPRRLCQHCRGAGMMEVINIDRSKEMRACRYCEAGIQKRTPKPCGHCQGTGLMQLFKTDGSRKPYPCLYCAAGMRLENARSS
jgi:hypothetical protein